MYKVIQLYILSRRNVFCCVYPAGSPHICFSSLPLYQISMFRQMFRQLIKFVVSHGGASCVRSVDTANRPIVYQNQKGSDMRDEIEDLTYRLRQLIFRSTRRFMPKLMRFIKKKKKKYYYKYNSSTFIMSLIKSGAVRLPHCGHFWKI